MRRVVLAMVMVSLGSATHAQLPQQPQSPAPAYSVAWKTKDGDLLLSYGMRIQSGGKPRLLRKHRRTKLADVTVSNAVGEKRSNEEVLDALKTPTIVLVSSDGRDVDPYYLKVVKRDTLVIVVKDHPWRAEVSAAEPQP